MKSLNINCETGEESLVDLSAAEVAEVEARSAEALAKLQTEPTLEQKLASVGLSLEELKAALA
jgi:hypothetical protein